MLLKIGQRPDHGFDRPLGLLSDCHRRIEHFLGTLVTIAQGVKGGPLLDSQRGQLEAALSYFAVAAPKHTADEEHSLFPRLRALHDARVTTRSCAAGLWKARSHLPASRSFIRGWTALRAIYDAHIPLEDGELFPAAARLLPEEQVREIGREMAARRGQEGPVT